MTTQMSAAEEFRIIPDTPVGFELTGVEKKAAIQTGEMSSAYIAEMCVNYLGAAMFRNARFNCKYISSILANEIIETGGRVTGKTPKGDGYRFTLEVAARNDAGQTKSVGLVEADIGV